MSRNSIEAVLVGAAQDGGLPQCGCDCTNCAAVRNDSQLSELPASLVIISHPEKRYWFIDATPAFPEQMARVITVNDTNRKEDFILNDADMVKIFPAAMGG